MSPGQTCDVCGTPCGALLPKAVHIAHGRRYCPKHWEGVGSRLQEQSLLLKGWRSLWWGGWVEP